MGYTYKGYGGQPYTSAYDAFMSTTRANPSGTCSDAYGVYSSSEEQARARWNREHPDDQHYN